MNTINQDGIIEKPKPGIPSIETRLLADYLGKLESEVATYEQMSAVIGEDVQGRARGYLLTAREIVLREKGLVFRPLRNVGIKRLSNTEIAKLEDRPRHILQTAKKQRRELRAVDIPSLPASERAGHVGKMALAEMDIHTHSPKQMKRLESVLAAAPMRQINLAATLDIFREESKEKSA